MIWPKCAIGLAGVTFIDTRVTVDTVSPVESKTPPQVAFIVVVPPPTAVANPFDAAALLIVAID